MSKLPVRQIITTVLKKLRSNLEHVAYIADKGAWNGVSRDPLSLLVLDLRLPKLFSKCETIQQIIVQNYTAI